jgi:signal transduction histidine kinase
MYFVNANSKNDYMERAALLEKRFVENSQEEVKNEVERMIKRMDAIRENNMERKKSSVALKVSSAAEYVSLSLSRGGSYKSADFGRMISAFKGADDSDRFFIVAEDGKIIYHEEDKSFIGRNIMEILKGGPEMKAILSELRDNGGGFGSYILQDNLSSSGGRKIGYVQKLKDSPLFI